MALDVIGAGFGRTGTTSLKVALERLGFEKCHHMQEVAPSRRQVEAWQAIADGEAPDWDAVFDGYRAACDWPSCTYWEALCRHYPDARVVLTLRDEVRWWDSVAETIYPASSLPPRWIAWAIPPLARFRKMVFAQVWDGVFGGRFEDREYATQLYREHNAAVRAGVPAERLLVFEVKDGWEPLCRFLGVPVPDEAFPHANDAVRIRRALLAARIVGWGSIVAIAAGALALALRAVGAAAGS